MTVPLLDRLATGPLLADGAMGTMLYARGVAFDRCFDQLNLTDPALVAEGISLALITTAGGLIVAVFTLPFYNYFTTKIGAFVQEMETSANFLFETFEEVKEFSAKGGPKGGKTSDTTEPQ